MVFNITRENISLTGIFSLIADKNATLELGADFRKLVVDGRQFLLEEIKRSDKPIYGVNTGFGSLCNTEISKDQIAELQKNLVVSHACGVGEVIPQELSRIILLLKIINLSYGHSGIRIETLERLIFMFNHNLIPVIYEQGSLGASGDLAPLAHLSLPLIGRGEVWFEGGVTSGEEALNKFKLEALELGAKEGLALLNGTQFMSAYAVYILFILKKLEPSGYLITAASLDAFDCMPDPFSEEIQKIRAHPGQIEVAAGIRSVLEHSEITAQRKSQVQDPYSFRCIPQVHGASFDTISFFTAVVEREIQSVTDNPIVFPEAGSIISAGNFHGQPLALGLDYMCIAISELSNISERRVYKLISGQRGLPPFLIQNPGLNSGFMIVQYTAASMVSQNKQLCTPASVDSIDSSNGQEDHVSMGANAALKCLRVLKNYKRLLGIELFCASQALYFRNPLKSSPQVETFLENFRKNVTFVKGDTEMSPLMRRAEEFVSGQT